MPLCDQRSCMLLWNAFCSPITHSNNDDKQNATSKGDEIYLAGPERVELSVSESESDALTTWPWPNFPRNYSMRRKE